MKRKMYGGADFRFAKSIEELQTIGRRRIPNFCMEYIEGGSDDELTLERNRTAFDKVGFVPKTLIDVSARSQMIDIFGKPSASPFLIGPTGFSGLVAKQGDLALAKAAAAAGIPFVLSNASTMKFSEVAEQSGARLWMQIYLYRTREHVRKLVERLKNFGIEAIVVTTDSAIYGNREWDLRNYVRPLELNWRNKIDVAMHPRWIYDVLVPAGVPRFANLEGVLEPGKDSVKGAATAIGKELDPSLSWADIQWLRDIWPGRLIIKGIMRADDAQKAVSLGADAIVLSNHGGRQLDGAMSSFETLQEVCTAVDGRLLVMLDGGFRRGTDILKARALGAHSAWVGRATTYGLAAGGEDGVSHAISLLKAEIDRGLGLLGCADIRELDTDYVRVVQ